MPAGLLDSDGCISRCFFIRDDGTTVEYKLKTDPPEAVFWSTYKLKPAHIKVVGKYDRKTKTALAREICNDIVQNEREQTRPALEDKIRQKRKAASKQHAEVRQE